MAKRFTDTVKWNKPFVRSLQAPYKLLWFYITDDCDHAGIWQVDEDVAKIRIGCEVDFDEAKRVFKNHIVIFDNGQKWFIPDFIEFQYGELNPANRVHLSILQIHKKYKIKPLISPLQGAKDKDKDMDKEKDKEIKVPEISEFLEYAKMVCREIGYDFEPYKFSITSKYESWVSANWKDGNKKEIKDWKGKFRSTLPYLKPLSKVKVEPYIQPSGKEYKF